MARWRGYVRSADTLWTSAPTVAWSVTRPAVDGPFCGPGGQPPRAPSGAVDCGCWLRWHKFTHERI